MGIYKDNIPDLGNNGHCFAPKWYKMSQNYQPQQTCGLSMLVYGGASGARRLAEYNAAERHLRKFQKKNPEEKK